MENTINGVVVNNCEFFCEDDQKCNRLDKEFLCKSCKCFYKKYWDLCKETNTKPDKTLSYTEAVEACVILQQMIINELKKKTEEKNKEDLLIPEQELENFICRFENIKSLANAIVGIDGFGNANNDITNLVWLLQDYADSCKVRFEKLLEIKGGSWGGGEFYDKLQVKNL